LLYLRSQTTKKINLRKPKRKIAKKRSQYITSMPKEPQSPPVPEPEPQSQEEPLNKDHPV